MDYWPSREEREEFSKGVDAAFEIFAQMQKEGFIKELCDIVQDPSKNRKLDNWIDMAVILAIKNRNITSQDPFSEENDTMLIYGHDGIRDLVLKGFLYGLFWKDKQLETDKLDRMWQEG